MAQLGGLPEWLTTALVAAVIAALGFVGSMIVDSVIEFRADQREHRAQLVGLHSLLQASLSTFRQQAAQRDRLADLILENRPEMGVAELSAEGYENLFAETFAQFTTEELELHGIVRGMTTHAMRPTNAALLGWLQEDVYYRGQRTDRGEYAELARLLPLLHTHLLLWQAKYEVWIPEHPEHALVYLADEQQHGVRFPSEINGEVERLLGLGSLVD